MNCPLIFHVFNIQILYGVEDSEGIFLIVLCDLVTSEATYLFLLSSLLIGVCIDVLTLLFMSNVAITDDISSHPASISDQRRALRQVSRNAIVYDRVLGPD